MIEAIEWANDAPALLIENGEKGISYRELGRRVDAVRERLRVLPQPAVMFQFMSNSVGAVVGYLACLAERIPLGLGEPAVAARERVIATYAPTAVMVSAGEDLSAQGYVAAASTGEETLSLWFRKEQSPFPVSPHPGLALLLATSGSTGAAKFVRLSRANLSTNAQAIARYLGITPGEIAIQSLPLHYSYGLSVLNSHLVSGAAVTLTAHSFMRPEFWRVVDDCGCTSFAGVPYMYETLYRLRTEPMSRPSMRTLTQAGGHLRVELVRLQHEAAERRGRRFFVMYGQTEATARMAYVPPERLGGKLGTIGIAIPDGQLWLEPLADDPSARQLFYRGPNVMMGYAAAPSDLAAGDELRGVLATGDLAESDEEGYFRVTGRLARFAKLFGKRISLLSVEEEIEQRFSLLAAAFDGGDALKIFLEGATSTDGPVIRAHLAALMSVPPGAIKLVEVERLPRTASGKKDYKALA